MLRPFFLMATLLMALSSKAELAYWLISPAQDSLRVAVDNRALAADSLGWTTVYDTHGNPLFKTDYLLRPFSESLAVLTQKTSNELVGFINVGGQYTPLPKGVAVYDDPYFHNGFLIFMNDGIYNYYNNKGQVVNFPVNARAYPFSHGYAPYMTYAQMEKRKDPYYSYYRTEGKPMQYSIVHDKEMKNFDPHDVQFLSGISPDGRGVAIIKNKVYWFNTSNGYFEPMLWGNDPKIKNRHLQLTSNYDVYFENLPTDSVVIRAKYGKNLSATLRFDKRLIPTWFTFEGEDLSFAPAPPAPYVYPSDLKAYKEGDLWGLTHKGQKALPPQFDQVGLLNGNTAFVKKHGKWGLLAYLPADNFELEMNQNKAIAFRHKAIESELCLRFPQLVPAKDVVVQFPDTKSCKIEQTSRMIGGNEFGHVVTYKCTLGIPSSLPDTVVPLTYEPFQVSINNIQFFDRPITVDAWHYKLYNVDPIDSETTISGGVASFTFNVDIQRTLGESDYPFDVKAQGQDVTVTCEKISEVRYKCNIYDLHDGINNINVLVIEEGCPPSVFPFEVNYTKPRKQAKEAVVVRKKTPEKPAEPSGNQLIKMDL
ncbi:MAG: WG repeat-containing protein [Bacteroidales bacterium]|nr:WG repeat-containing protein [Bacteroidales bacterium]